MMKKFLKVDEINDEISIMKKCQIKTKKINYNKVKLILASLKDYPTIQNMGRFYVYDMSEYVGDQEGWEMPEDGLYECIDFKNIGKQIMRFLF